MKQLKDTGGGKADLTEHVSAAEERVLALLGRRASGLPKGNKYYTLKHLQQLKNRLD